MAGVPHPEDALARLQKLLAKGLPPVLAITGPNDLLRAEAVELVLAAVPKDAELRVVDAVEVRAGGGSESDGDEGDADGDDDAAAAADDRGLAACPELQDLRGGGLFARRSFVVIRRGAKWWRVHGPTVAALAPKFQRGSGLVLEASRLDKRKKVCATFVKQLAECGAEFEFRDLYDLPFDRSRSPLEGELCKWVVRRAGKLGVPLLPEAAWLIVLQVGKSLPELLAELGRLRDRLGGRSSKQPLGPDDLRGRLTCSFESTPFDLADAVLGGDRRAALRSVRAMFDRGVRGKDGRTTDAGGVLPFTTSWLHRSIATAYEGRVLLDGGVSPRDLPARAGVRGFADRFVDQVRRNDRATLRRGLMALRHCQRMSRLSGEEPSVLLEQFLSQWFDGAPIPTAEDLEL